MRQRGLNGNALKCIACLSMLIDHTGLLLFPQLPVLRWCGRLAMPLFAFLLAEGCRYTRDRRRYFWRMCGLGLLCQAAYVAQTLLSGSNRTMILNILLTFSVSLPLCFAWLDLREARRQAVGQGRAVLRIVLILLIAGALNRLGEELQPLIGMRLAFDYGLPGMVLPLFALIGETKAARLISFGLGLVGFCLSLCDTVPFIWWALLTLPLLLLYTGQRGDKRWQLAFYVFYPAHLAVLGLLAFVIA